MSSGSAGGFVQFHFPRSKCIIDITSISGVKFWQKKITNNSHRMFVVTTSPSRVREFHDTVLMKRLTIFYFLPREYRPIISKT